MLFFYQQKWNPRQKKTNCFDYRIKYLHISSILLNMEQLTSLIKNVFGVTFISHVFKLSGNQSLN